MKPRRLSRPAIALIGAVHLIAVALTWRDISRRPADRVRGNKTIWRLATGLNTGGATLAYLLIGRHRDS